MDTLTDAISIITSRLKDLGVPERKILALQAVILRLITKEIKAVEVK